MEKETIYNVLNEAGERIQDAMINNLLDNGSLGTGELAKSIDWDIVEDKDKYVLTINMFKYGLYVDEGRGRGPGGMPPLQPIMDWMKKKGLQPTLGKSKLGYAFAIAKNIAKNGTNPRPKPFIQKSFTQVENQYLNEALEEAGAKDIELFMETQFKKNGAKVS